MKSTTISAPSRRYVLLAVILLAFAVRAWDLGANAIWLDEAMEVLTATAKPSQLIRDIASHIQDPPLFTVMLKSWLLLGSQEYFLRFLPLAFSVIAVAVLVQTAGRLEGPVAAIVAGLLFAFSPAQIRYAQDVGQYAPMQAFLAMNLLALVLLCQRPSRWRYVLWTASAVAAVYTYYGAALVVFVSSIVLVVWAWRQRKRDALISAGISLGAIVLLLLPLVLWMLPQQYYKGPTADGLSFAWLGLLEEIRTLAASTNQVAAFQFAAWPYTSVPVWIVIISVGIPLIAVVLYGSALPRRVLIWLACATFFYYLVSRLGLYPYKFRYGLILSPLLFTNVAAGVGAAFNRGPKLAGAASLASVALLLATGLYMLPQGAVRQVFQPTESWAWPEIENTRDVIAYWKEHRQNGDMTYVYSATLPAFEYYMAINPDGSDPTGGSCWLTKAPEQCAYEDTGIGEWIRGLPIEEQAESVLSTFTASPDRLWLLFSHIVPREDTDVITALSEQYEVVDEFHEHGASAYFLRKRQAQQMRVATVTFQCLSIQRLFFD